MSSGLEREVDPGGHFGVPHTSRLFDPAQAASAVSHLNLRRSGPLFLRPTLVANAGMGKNDLRRVAALPMVAFRGQMAQGTGAALAFGLYTRLPVNER